MLELYTSITSIKVNTKFHNIQRPKKSTDLIYCKINHNIRKYNNVEMMLTSLYLYFNDPTTF